MPLDDPERSGEDAPGPLPADAPPMPPEPPTAGSEEAPEPDAAAEEIERLKAELAELKAANEKDAAERQHAEAISSATQKFSLPDGVLAAVAEFVPTESLPDVAKEISTAIHRAAKPTGVGSGGLSPGGETKTASWSALFSRK